MGIRSMEYYIYIFWMIYDILGPTVRAPTDISNGWPTEPIIPDPVSPAKSIRRAINMSYKIHEKVPAHSRDTCLPFGHHKSTNNEQCPRYQVRLQPFPFINR